MKKYVFKENDVMYFGEEFPDGRLVADPKPENKRFRFREAIKLVEKLGRPLTNEEMKQFEKAANA